MSIEHVPTIPFREAVIRGVLEEYANRSAEFAFPAEIRQEQDLEEGRVTTLVAPDTDDPAFLGSQPTAEFEQEQELGFPKDEGFPGG